MFFGVIYRVSYSIYWSIYWYIPVIYIIQQSPAPNTEVVSKILASLIQKMCQHRIWFCYCVFNKSSTFGWKPTYLGQTWVFPIYSLYEVKEKRYETIILLSLIALLFRRDSGDCRLQQFLMHHLCSNTNIAQHWKRRSCNLPIPS